MTSVSHRLTSEPVSQLCPSSFRNKCPQVFSAASSFSTPNNKNKFLFTYPLVPPLTVKFIAVKYLTGQHVPTTCQTILLKPNCILVRFVKELILCLCLCATECILPGHAKETGLFSFAFRKHLSFSNHASNDSGMSRQYQRPFVEDMLFVDSKKYFGGNKRHN